MCYDLSSRRKLSYRNGRSSSRLVSELDYTSFPPIKRDNSYCTRNPVKVGGNPSNASNEDHDLLRIVIVISKLLKRHLKAKRRAPDYLRELRLTEMKPDVGSVNEAGFQQICIHHF